MVQLFAMQGFKISLPSAMHHLIVKIPDLAGLPTCVTVLL